MFPNRPHSHQTNQPHHCDINNLEKNSTEFMNSAMLLEHQKRINEFASATHPNASKSIQTQQKATNNVDALIDQLDTMVIDSAQASSNHPELIRRISGPLLETKLPTFCERSRLRPRTAKKKTSDKKKRQCEQLSTYAFFYEAIRTIEKLHHLQRKTEYLKNRLKILTQSSFKRRQSTHSKESNDHI